MYNKIKDNVLTFSHGIILLFEDDYFTKVGMKVTFCGGRQLSPKQINLYPSY